MFLTSVFILLAAFLSQTIKIDNDIVKFDIWDTAGQERYGLCFCTHL